MSTLPLPIVPCTVPRARGLLLLVALGHIAAPFAIGLAQNQAHGPATAVAGAVAIHTPLLVLTLLLFRRLPSGRPWTRRVTTASQVLSLLFGVLLWSSPTTSPPLVVALGAAQLTIVTLLWTPASRHFFGSTRPGAPG